MSNVSKEIAIELVEDGQAGNGIVSITRTYGISASGTTASDTTSPSDITTWSAGSPTVTTAKPYLWVKEITVYTEIPDTTKYYCVGKRGDNGVDAKDVEWAYIRTTTPTPPTILNDSTYTDSNSKTYTADGHLPRVDSTNRTDIEKENSGSSSKYYECTDDPKGVDDEWKYEWEIKRTKGDVGVDGSTRTWNYYVDEMTLHNNYAESAFIIDIDNDNDQFGTDSDSKVLAEQTRSTIVTLYDGATPQTLTSLAATLKYENGTSVPTSVATKTTDATTGAVSVTVLQNNTTNTHTEIQAHISATCAKGTKTIVFTLYKVMGGAPGLTPIIYNVAATDKVFSFQRTDANALTPSSRTSQINVARTEGNTTTILDTAQTGLTFSWGFDDETTAQATGQSIGDSIEITSTDATSHSCVWVELSTGDRETLAIVKDGAKGNSGTSVEAQYAPNSSPTSSQIHITFQNGDKYMRTRSGNGSWSDWQKIVGENGAETDFTFNISKDKTSTNASTAPANCYYGAWQDAPIAVTTTYPYLWAKVVQKDGDGTIQSTSYIRLTGEDGKSVLAQYSVDGSSNWHSTFATGDEWMRTSENGGTSWSTAMKIVGENGDSTNFEFGISQYQTATGAPSDISTWSDAPIATTSSKPYLWSKVTTPDGTVSYIRLTGEKGVSIVIASQSVTYSKQTSGNLDPTTLTYGNYPSSLSKGDWLYSKTTINYQNSEGASAGSTSTYSVSYIGTDGVGRGITRVDEYYLAGNSSTTPPTGTWVTNPNNAGWSATNKYLWNYEDVVYTDSTSVPTDKSVVAMWTEDGAGIDSITNYYLATSASSGVTTSTSGWTPAVQTMDETNCYLWNYERIAYTQGKTATTTTPHIIGHYGRDGEGIASANVWYALSTSSSTAPSDSSFTYDSFPTTLNSGYYVWEATKVTYTDDSSEFTGKMCLGATSEFLAGTEVYATSTSSSTTPTSWSTTYTKTKGYYLWTATRVQYTNGTYAYLNPKCVGYWGEDGVSSLVVDIDNDSDQFGTDSNGLTLSAQSKATGVKLYYGTTLQTITKLVATVYRASAPSTSIGSASATTSGTEVSGNVTISSTKVATIKSLFSGTSGTVTFGIVNNVTINDDFIIKIEVFRSSSESRIVNFTLKQVKSGAAGVAPDLCNLRPTLAKVSFTKSELSGSTAKKLGCGYTLVTPSGTTNTTTAASVSVNGTTYYIWWRYVGGTYAKFTTSSTIYSTGILPSTTQTGVEFVLSSASSSGNIAAANTLDYENVPIIKDGTDGTSPIHLTIDNEHEDFLYSQDGTLVAPSSVVINAHLWDGNTEVLASNVSWTAAQASSSGIDYTKLTIGTGVYTLTGISGDTAKLVIQAEYPKNSGNFYQAVFTANKTQQDKYDLVFSDNAIAYNPATYTSQTQKRIKVYANVTNLSGATSRATISTSTSTPSAGTLRLYATYGGNTVQITDTVTENSITKHYLDVTPTIAAANDGIYFELRRYTGSSAYDVVDYETVEIAKVQNGDGGLSIAITPNTMAVNTDASGVTESASQDFSLKVYKGASEVAVSEYTITHSSLPNNNWTWTGLYSNAFRIACASGTTFTTPVAITVTVALSSGGSISTAVLLVPNKRGNDGDSAIRIDLTNDMDAIQYADNTKVGDSVTTEVNLYNGTTQLALTTDYTLSLDATGCTASKSGKVITVSGISNGYDRGYVVITAVLVSDNTKTYSIVFTVMKLMNQDKFYINTNGTNVIPINTTTTPSGTTYPINITVMRDGINPQSKKVETSLVQTLSNYGLYLYIGSEDRPNAISGYSSGYTYNFSSALNNIHIYITTSSTFSTSTVLDHEIITTAKVQNGSQGEKGDVARQPYEWGKWSDFIADNSNTFVANKYEAPYFIKEDEETVAVGSGSTAGNIKRIQQNKWLWVGEDGEYVPPGATPGSGQQNATIPSSSDENWELMVTDFKYLISEAQIADYGKFGAGIFSKDYAFSQYGRIDGASKDVNHYKNFRPEFFKGQPYVMFEGVKNISSGDYPTSTPYEFGQLYLDSGLTYTFKFTFGNIIANKAEIKLVRIASNGALATWSTTSSVMEIERSATITTAGDYAIRIGAQSSNFNVKKIEVTVDRAFRPNIYIDWLKGEIYSQLGRFVNVTIEGVLNNLMQTITNENMSQYGICNGSTSTYAFWLNPTKVGSIIHYQASHPLNLPSVFYNNGMAIVDNDTQTHQVTLQDMRQCVGKKIYVHTDNNTSMTLIRSGLSAHGMLVYPNNNVQNLSNMSSYGSTSGYTKTYEFGSNTNMSDRFFVLECKMGQYNNYECIYWELNFNTAKLT